MSFLFRSHRPDGKPDAVTREPPSQGAACRFTPPPPARGPVKSLVRDGPRGVERYPFHAQLEIGRDEDGRPAAPGFLLVESPSVSFRHCIIIQTPEGHCLVRDVSRNGTRLDGRRLVPNVETELRVGQTLDLGAGLQFVLQGEPNPPLSECPVRRCRTEAAPQLTLATVLVGDIRDYTVLVRKAPVALLQQSVSRIFETLTASVAAAGGTVKEFPGDAIVAFWEGDHHGRMAVTACRAALELDRVVRRIATDPSVWALPDFPLRMDWGLASGQVMIDSFGGRIPVGLSMIGEAVVLACRLEKLATDQTGTILACPITRELAARASRFAAAASDCGRPPLEFTDLGQLAAKGFDRPDHVFALRIPDV